MIEKIPLWGIQFDGHGALRAVCQSCNRINKLDNGRKLTKCEGCKKLSKAKKTGVLAFEQNGGIDLVRADEFGSVIYNTGIQLAILLACESSKIGNRVVFNALSPNLILAGVPAVIGMQFPVLDSFANDFANHFYNEFFKTKDVIQSVRTARKMTFRSTSTWYSPTLYLRHKPYQDEDYKPIYEARQIDTAVPSEVLEGDNFFVRLWVRRLKTEPSSDEQLRKDLGISESVNIRKKTYKADVKFELVEDRTFRSGELTVKLESPECEIEQDCRKLFIHEHRDAPPAYFALKAKKIGEIQLIFTILQDEHLIASVAHLIESIQRFEEQDISIQKSSSLISGKKEEINLRDDEKDPKCKAEWIPIGKIAQISDPPAHNHAGVKPSGILEVGDLIRIVGKGYERTQLVNSLIPRGGLDWIDIESWPVKKGFSVYVCAQEPPPNGPGPGPGSGTGSGTGSGSAPSKPKPKPKPKKPKPRKPKPKKPKPKKPKPRKPEPKLKAKKRGGCV